MLLKPPADSVINPIKPPETFYELILNFPQERFDQVVFRAKPADEFQNITYGDFLNNVKSLACALVELGVVRGDKIGLISENRIEWPLIYLALTLAGAVVVPIDIFHSYQELHHVMSTSDMRMVFTSGGFYKKVSTASCDLKQIRRLIVFGQDREVIPSHKKITLYTELLKTGKKRLRRGGTGFDHTAIKPNDPAALIYSHGSLFVELSHKAILANANGLLETSNHVFRADDVFLSVLPLHHTFPIMFGFLVPFMSHSTTRFLSTTRPDILLQALKETEPTTLILVPLMAELLCHTIYDFLIREKWLPGDLDKHDDVSDVFRQVLLLEKGRSLIENAKKILGLSKIRYVVVGGAKTPVRLLETMNHIGLPVYEGYGLTETSPVVSGNFVNTNRVGSVGRPLNNVRVKIENPDARGNGEILVKGPNMMTGYYRMPEKTGEIIDGKGWLHTGDMGRLDDDGYLYITGRMKNVIINSGGKNIYPKEIEDALFLSPFIAEAVIVPALGEGAEYPRAFIRPEFKAIYDLEKQKQRRMSDDEVKAFLLEEVRKIAGEIPKYKMPLSFEISYDRLPEKIGVNNPLVFEQSDLRSPNKTPEIETEETTTCGEEASYFDYTEHTAHYMVRQVAKLLNVDESSIDTSENILDFLNSIELTDLSQIIENDFHIRLNPALIFEYTSIAKLSEYCSMAFDKEVALFFKGRKLKELKTPENNKSEIRHHPRTEKKQTEKPEFRDPIAIIGMFGRFPQSKDLDEFWNHLESGTSLISRPPKGRFKNIPGEKQPSIAGGFIDEMDGFDPFFFNISPREAELMDPQQRVFMEVVWKALEDACIKPSSLSGTRTGVFAGVATHDYSVLYDFESPDVDPFSATGFAHSILANRISYFLNLTGPSEVVDTACSSSLVALHRAIQAMDTGECDMAIVGGVNALLTAGLFNSFSKAGMLSPDGTCKTFSRDADGYSRGEGAGVVILKPLGGALQDNNRIYALLRGTAVSHGGRANTMVAPNPLAQANAITGAYTKAGISPDTVSYIEAHGTGTALGDPVEINGLKHAFNALYDMFNLSMNKTGYCGLGSVKTNIGHLEAAAGIAGLIKVILSLNHKTIPPSINFTGLNPYIELEASPFYIAEKRQHWECLKDENGKTIPRRAGISSFGFGGVNAHAVLEEYSNPVHGEEATALSPCIIPLSARNRNALKRYAAALVTFLEREMENGASLKDIAYTLQVGRESMKERLAVIAHNKKELQSVLRSWFQDEKTNEQVFKGTVGAAERKSTKETLPVSSIEQDHEIAKLWVSGENFKWEEIYGQFRPRLIPLPTYPFERRKYWIPEEALRGVPPSYGSNRSPKLHPMIDKNVSDFQGQQYATRFTGREFYIADHKMAGQKYLPGIAYLEMARVAGELAGGKKVAGLRNIVWLRPITVEKPVIVYTRLQVAGDSVSFEMHTHDQNKVPVKHAHGVIVYEINSVPDVEIIDIEEIVEECPRHLEAQECYTLFDSAGMTYGPGFRPLKTIYVNKNEAIARLELPEPCYNEFHDFQYHPSLVDGALQSVIGLVADTGKDRSTPYFPFTLDNATILKPLPEKLYAHVTRGDSFGESNTAIKKYNITMADLSGLVVAKLTGFSVSPGSNAAAGTTTNVTNPDVVHFSVEWNKHLPETSPGDPSSGNESYGHILIFDTREGLFKELCKTMNKNIGNTSKATLVKPGKRFRKTDRRTIEINPNSPGDYEHLLNELTKNNRFPAKVIHLWSDGDFPVNPEAIKTGLSNSIDSMFYLCRALMNHHLENRLQLIYGYYGTPSRIQPHHAAVSGFIRSVALENIKVTCKTLMLDATGLQGKLNQRLLCDILLNELADPFLTEDIRYLNGERYVRRHKETQLTKGTGTGLKKNGVYLITGGMGGLGFIFARHIAKSVNARIVLTGRSNINSRIRDKLHELENMGSSAEYFRADLSRQSDVEKLSAWIKQSLKGVNGIIHSAGLARDSFLAHATEKDLEAVLAPKVHGTIFLDTAFKHENLDFFVLFSSVAGVRGNIGQAGYAYANSFLDYFSEMREQMRKKGRRFGKTVSINWPLWKDGGIKVDKSTEKLFSILGIEAMKTETGLATFDLSLTSELNQVVVVEGHRKKILNVFKPRKSPHTKQRHIGSHARETLTQAVRNDIRTLVAGIIKINPEYIEFDEEVRNYGFGSISFTEFAYRLNEKYSLDLTPTVFFEYTTIGAFVDFLCEEYGEELLQVYDSPSIEFSSKSYEKNASHPHNRPDQPTGPPSHGNEPVAIIGMSGVMPGASDLETFWHHLDRGHDLVTEIPETRWDWRAFYGNPLKEKNKTDARYGGFIPDVDTFDAEFFQISPSEAEWMDPQQRIFLEVVWKTVENSGYRVADLAGTRTGVFAASITSDYLQLLSDNLSDIPAYMLTGTAKSMIPNRISYLLNLKGPSEPVDTACSSSLVAIHRGVEAILGGSCDMAIAGGIHLIFDPRLHVGYNKAGILSPGGRCRPFDSCADGIVRSEGVGAVLLKPLKQAQADGDYIHGVVRSTSVNHGGRVNTLTTPNPNAQAELLRDAYEKARIDPATISYIEAHGTGTRLGDPIEINGIKKAFESASQNFGDLCLEGKVKKPVCGIGSVKSNIGHLEAAAGIAGLIKVLLAMKHKRLPATIHIENLNPNIRVNDSPLYIVDKPTPWKNPVDETGKIIPLRAGISSFGFGGSNAHVVIEESPAESPHRSLPEGAPLVFVLSAKNKDRLRQYAQDVRAYLLNMKQTDNADHSDRQIAHTLQTGRDEMEERLAFVFHNMEEACEKLKAYTENTKRSDLYTGTTHKTGGGASEELPLLQPFHDETLMSIARGWVNGKGVDWNLFYPEGKPKKIPLPSYPFARTRYWLPAVRRVAAGADTIHVHKKLMPGTPDKKRIRDEITTIVADILKTDPSSISNDFTSDDSGIDSLAFMDIVQRMNIRYDLNLDFHDISDIKSMDGLAEFVFLRLHPQESHHKKRTSGPSAEDIHQPDTSIKTTNAFHHELKQVFPNIKVAGLDSVHVKVRNQMEAEVLTAGDGPPLILLPPLDCNAVVWGNQITELSNHYKVMIFHYPGYGTSPFNPEHSGLTDIAEMVFHTASHMGINGPFHLAGWSMGGFIAQIIALKNPEIIRSLTLVNTAPSFKQDSSLENINRLAILLRKDFMSFPHKTNGMDLKKLHTAITATESLYIKKHYFKEVLQFDMEDSISQIETPTLIISGRNDRMISIKQAKKIHQCIKNSKYLEHETAGHYIPLHHYSYFNNQLNEFLKHL